MRYLITFLVCMFMGGSCYAGHGNNNISTLNTNFNSTNQGQNQSLDNANYNSDTNWQDQDQMQDQDQGVQIEEGDTKILVAPTTNAQKGQYSTNVYSIVGGIGIAETEQYQMCMDKIELISKLADAGYLTDDEAQAEMDEAFAQLKHLTKTKKFLGVLWRTSGCNLGSGFGLLAW